MTLVSAYKYISVSRQQPCDCCTFLKILMFQKEYEKEIVTNYICIYFIMFIHFYMDVITIKNFNFILL